MKPSAMNMPWQPERLDARALALAEGQLGGETPLKAFSRLTAEVFDEGGQPDAAAVNWKAQGQMRSAAHGGEAEIWLHLQASTHLPIQCQRCLGPVDTALVVDRWFRFVADEATAEAQDDESEEDVLALEPRMSLYQLMEDELLMALPLVPMHDTCPVPVLMQVQDPELASSESDNVPPHPFAALAKLKK